MEIWALLDNRIGNNKQTLALAKALGTFKTIAVSYNLISKLPNKILGTSKLGFTANSEGKPDLIICTGRKLSRIARILKKTHNCKIIQIMMPSNSLKDFDLIITPEHDITPNLPNILKITGALCSNSFESSPQNNLATVLIGNLTKQEAINLCKILKSINYKYQITTSRRTSKSAIKVLESNFKIYKYGSKQPNPYDSYFSSCELFIVSGDSVNMLTEAAHTGKPVYIFETKTKKKFITLWQKLYALGCAKPLTNELSKWTYKPLNNINIVLSEISKFYVS